MGGDGVYDGGDRGKGMRFGLIYNSEEMEGWCVRGMMKLQG